LEWRWAGVKVLLDTHALIWWLDADQRLSPRVFKLLSDKKTQPHVSAVSTWEIATKQRAGKLNVDAAIFSNLPAALIRSGFLALPISLAHGYRAGQLGGSHKDPFDRMLAAQSLIEELPLVTVDAAFKIFGVTTIW
jgi:PIN domain nuclease of toxin-antitoxin system